jgi:hypothetical protein
MRTIIRRMIILPLAIIACPLVYFISWCYVGHKKSIASVKDFMLDTWKGVCL